MRPERAQRLLLQSHEYLMRTPDFDWALDASRPFSESSSSPASGAFLLSTSDRLATGRYFNLRISSSTGSRELKTVSKGPPGMMYWVMN